MMALHRPSRIPVIGHFLAISRSFSGRFRSFSGRFPVVFSRFRPFLAVFSRF